MRKRKILLKKNDLLRNGLTIKFFNNKDVYFEIQFLNLLSGGRQYLKTSEVGESDKIKERLIHVEY